MLCSRRVRSPRIRWHSLPWTATLSTCALRSEQLSLSARSKVPSRPFATHRAPAPLARTRRRYVSCNSDEGDPFGSKPKDPQCICWCWDDRTISLQPWSQLVAACGNGNRSNATIEPFVSEIECNCRYVFFYLPLHSTRILLTV